MILGGRRPWSAHAVARRLLQFQAAARFVLVALFARETEESAAAPRARTPGRRQSPSSTATSTSRRRWPAGDRVKMMEDPLNVRLLVEDTFGDLNGRSAGPRSLLVQLLEKHRPDAVIDCVNTATAFRLPGCLQVHQAVAGARGRAGKVDQSAIERARAWTMPIPQLTRHVQILKEGLRRAGTRALRENRHQRHRRDGAEHPLHPFPKEKPSRTLLTKSASGRGAHACCSTCSAAHPVRRRRSRSSRRPPLAGARSPMARCAAPAGRFALYDCPAALPIATGLRHGGWMGIAGASTRVGVHQHG